MKQLLNYLLKGILYTAPLGLTIYIIYVAFKFADGLMQKFLVAYFDIVMPGLGLITLIGVLMLIGFLGNVIFTRPVRRMFIALIKKVPVLNFVFFSLNDLFGAFIGNEKKFNKPVSVSLDHLGGFEKLGFVTEEDLAPLNSSEKVAVYFPHSYNFSGELFIVPKANVRSLNVSSKEVMKFIISAGVTGW
jgi:uncharacterized membrane protein